ARRPRSRGATRRRSRSRSGPTTATAAAAAPRVAARLVDRRPRRPDHRCRMPRRFTPREANDELAEIRPLVEQLVSHRQEQQRLQTERQELATRIAGNGGGIDASELGKLEEAERAERIEIARCVNAIHERGAIVKDLDTGLVDFPALRDGDE